MCEQVERLFIERFFAERTGLEAILVTDRKQVVLFENRGTIDVHFFPGDRVEREKITTEALATGKKMKGKSKLGDVSYYAIAEPVFSAGVVCGALTAIYSRKQEQLLTPFLTVRLSDRWVPLPFADVVYMEAQSRKTHVISVAEKGTHRLNLTELERLLPQESFFRCHRSYIINVDQVKEIQPDSHATLTLVMKNDARVPVSQNYVKFVRELFGI